nr:hypothetical protein [Tanacetum cinerariifolium]
HDYVNLDCLNVDACAHCVTTESELQPDFIKKESYETLLKQYHILETHCISLEVNNQLNTEIFQRDTVSSSESAPTFAELFKINKLKAQIQEKDTVILKLKEKLKSVSGDVKERKVEREVEEIETLNLELDHKVSDLNASLQEKVLVITALKEQLSKLKGKAVLTKAVSLNHIDPALLQVNVAPLVPKLRKNRTVHIDYIRHTQKEAATLREIVESERHLSPLNTSLDYACKYPRRIQELLMILQQTDYIRHTKKEAATLREIVESERHLSPLNTSLDYACKYPRRIQELLMILQQTCPSITDLRTNLVAVTPKNKTKQIRRTAQITKSEKTSVATSPSPNIDSNTLVLSFTGVALVSSASRSKSQDNTKKNKIQRTQKKAKETELEDHLRNVKSSLNKASVVDSKATSSVIKSVSNVNLNWKCASCNGCLFSDNHDACVVAYINFVNASRKSKSVKTPVKRKVVQIVLWYLDSGCSKHMTGDRSRLINFVQKFLGMVKFGNDHVAKIMGQFCDSDLEVAFRQHTCFIRNLKGVDLLTGSRRNNLYTLSLQDMMVSSPICLLSKASKTKSWLWHRRLSHLNFGAINHRARQGLVRGLSKLKFEKDNLCSACATGKSTKKT